MTYEYKPRGVCSQKMRFDIEDGIIKNLRVDGGCNGNLKGISALVEGMPAEDVISRLSGLRCGMRPSSCPDQLAQAVKAALEQTQGGKE